MPNVGCELRMYHRKKVRQMSKSGHVFGSMVVSMAKRSASIQRLSARVTDLYMQHTFRRWFRCGGSSLTPLGPPAPEQRKVGRQPIAD